MSAIENPHRPWPTPRTPWVMRMVWYDLLFAHWPVDPALIMPHLPEGLELDLWEGKAWLGVVPFGMKGIRLRGLPPVPGTSKFLELNLRTYVKADDKPGVFFFSLDAENPLAVRAARISFALPYFDAKMEKHESDEGTISYNSTRTHKGAAPGEFRGTYQPVGEVFEAQPGTVDYWLTERYCLYTHRKGRLLRGDINHRPWPLQLATCEIEHNTIAEAIGITLSAPPTYLHFARYLDVHAWMATPTH